jgi:hypothetical protein
MNRAPELGIKGHGEPVMQPAESTGCIQTTGDGWDAEENWEERTS